MGTGETGETRSRCITPPTGMAAAPSRHLPTAPPVTVLLRDGPFRRTFRVARAYNCF